MRARCLVPEKILAARVGRRAREPEVCPVKSLDEQPDLNWDGNDVDSDAATSDEDDDVPRRARLLRGKISRREKLVDASDCGNLTFLEWSAVKNPSNQRYTQALDRWLNSPEMVGVRLVVDAEGGEALVQAMNRFYLQGHPANVGEILMAALIHRLPEFGKFGHRHIPRAHRALKGWRRRTPPRSRGPHTWSIWAMIVWDLARRGFWRMAIFTLWMVAGYFRPSELLGVCRGDLQRPVPNMSTHWHLLLFPEERPDRSKVYASNDSVEMFSKFCHCLPATVAVASEGPDNEKVFPFSYPAYLAQLRVTNKRLGLKVIPYEGRRSGPSIDAARGFRTAKEIQSRGRWAALKSVQRHESRARLTKSFNLLTSRQQSHALGCEAKLDDLILGRVTPEEVSEPVM